MPFQVHFTAAKHVHRGDQYHDREPDGRDCTMTDDVEGTRTTNGVFLPSPNPSPFCEKARSISLGETDNEEEDQGGGSAGESWVPHRRTSFLFGRRQPHRPPEQHRQRQQQQHHHQHQDLMTEARRVVFHPTQHPPQVHEFDWKVDFQPTTMVGSKRKASDKDDDDDDDDVNMEGEEDARPPPFAAAAAVPASTRDVFPAPPIVSNGNTGRFANPFRRQFSQRQEERREFDRPTKRRRRTTNQDPVGKTNAEHRDRHHRHKESVVRSRDSTPSSTNRISTTTPPNSILRQKASFGGGGGGSAASVSMLGSLDVDLNGTLDSTKSNDDFTRDGTESSKKRIRIVESNMTVVQRMTGSLLSFAGRRRQHGRRHRRKRQHGTGHRNRPWQKLGGGNDDEGGENDNDEDGMMDESSEPSGSTFWGDMPSIVSSSYSSVASSKTAIHNVQSRVLDCGDDNDDHSWMPPPNIRNGWKKNNNNNSNNNTPPMTVRGAKYFLSEAMPMVKPDPLGRPPATSTTTNFVKKCYHIGEIM